ncbi:MAG: hypothetical protein AAGA21_05760 [Pseudomonadota bacterium]
MRNIANLATAPRFGEQWLSQHQLGYADLDRDDRTAIREFALLWVIFESQTLFGDGRVKAMLDFVDDVDQAAEAHDRNLLTAPFIPHLTYFRHQFVDADRARTNDLFGSLMFPDPGSKEFVSQALVRLSDDTTELVKALLIIVHEFKNRLFGGLQLRHCEQKQRDDLYHASKVLMKATDMSRG